MDTELDCTWTHNTENHSVADNLLPKVHIEDVTLVFPLGCELLAAVFTREHSDGVTLVSPGDSGAVQQWCGRHLTGQSPQQLLIRKHSLSMT